MKYGIIYKATSPSGKVYIGQTTQKFRMRKYSHKSLSYDKRSRCYHLKFARAIRKYGFDNIQWEVLEFNIPIKKIDELEMFYIKYYDSFHNGYNSNTGGIRSPRGLKHSEKTKKLISQNRKGKRVTQQVRDKISQTLTGRKLTQSHRKHIGLASSARRHTEETKKKLSASHTGKKHKQCSKDKVSVANKGRFPGAKNPSSKLKEQDVLDIRSLYSTGNYTYKSIGKIYDVSESCVYLIVKRKKWRHI